MFYALAKDENKILDKVNLFVALAPTTRMNHVKNAIKKTSGHINVIKTALIAMSIHELFDENQTLLYKNYMDSFTGKMLTSWKDMIVNYVTGDPEYCREKRVEVPSNRFPNEASTREIYHSSQIVAAE